MLLMNNGSNVYIIALLTNEDFIIPLDVGRKYGRIAAMNRAEMLEQNCWLEKESLDGKKFIAYSKNQAT